MHFFAAQSNLSWIFFSAGATPALSKLSLLSTKYHAEICESESDHPYSEQFHHFPLSPQIVLSTDK